MTMRVLFRDEFEGFARSKAMLALWLGLPVVVILLRLIRPDTEEIPLFLFSGIMISTIGGTLSAVILSTAVTTDRRNHVYDLFLVRPVRRGTLILAKYFATLTVIVIAALVALATGIVADLIAGYPTGTLFQAGLEPLLLSFSGIAIACAVGVLLGTLIDSVTASAIIAVYLGNQLSAAALLPSFFLPNTNSTLLAIGVGVVIPALILLITVRVFARKTL
jgi:ABC-type transport system involved in multi-copper enzyme maturation permease subunit